MKRSKKENKQKVDPFILTILIIGAIIGAIVGGIIGLNEPDILLRIAIFIAAAFYGSILALYFVHCMLEAIEEIQNIIKERKIKKEGRGFID